LKALELLKLGVLRLLNKLLHLQRSTMKKMKKSQEDDKPKSPNLLEEAEELCE
jgi:hypothetical protein